MTYIVGLTGGIGSGKSTVANRFAAMGAEIVDTDQIARDITKAHGEAMPAIRDAFGAAYIAGDGSLDRAAMRSLAFTDERSRARLEAILHPAIRRTADAQLARAQAAYALLVVPLLFESRGHLDRVARVLVVDCAPELQVERTIARSGLDRGQVLAIMAAQWPRWRRLQSADDVAWNGGDAAALEPQCRELHAQYVKRAASSQ
jgi:dephospho-CoA kinase